MEFLADTVAIIRHFSKTGKIGLKAKKILKAADEGKHSIYISIISIVEILYLAERNRIPIHLEDVLSKVQNSDNYYFVELHVGIVRIAETVKGLELHDRLIVSSGKYLGLPILSSDRAISKLKGIEVIW